MPKKLVNIEKNVQNDEILIENTPDEDEIEHKNDVVVEKKRPGRPKGAIKDYKKECNYVILQMNDILGLKKGINELDCDILNDENGDLCKKILECLPDIRKYFRIQSWSYFKENTSQTPALLLKNLYHSQGYEVKQIFAMIGKVRHRRLMIKYE